MAILQGWRITRAGILFIVGIIVLAALVFATVWFVKERGEQARREEAVKIAEQNLEEQSKPAATETPQGNQATDSDQTAQPQATNGNGTAAELPATGASAGQIIALAALTLAGTSYILSRRALREV